MTRVSYALVVADTGKLLESWDQLPRKITWPNGDITEPAVVGSNGKHAIVELHEELPEESREQKIGKPTYQYKDGTLLASYELVERTEDEVAAWDSMNLQRFHPSDIVYAFDALGVADTALANVDALTLAKFYTAKNGVREDDTSLLQVLRTVGKTMEELKKAIASLG